MKQAISILLLTTVSFIANFSVFLYSYRILAFPHLHEAQRMENAPIIFSVVLAGFLSCAIVTAILARKLCINKKREAV